MRWPALIDDKGLTLSAYVPGTRFVSVPFARQ